MSSKLLYEEETYKVRGACYEVYREKGCGFTEAIYQECLEMEMTLQGIPYEAQSQIPLTYKDRKLRHTFVPDLICNGKIIVELKAVSRLMDEHRAQLLNYLHATGMRVGLLVNFGAQGGVVIERLLV
jgi:GxxExxY protein